MHNNLLLANPAGDEKLYIEDVFSTYLYTGNGSTQTITNGIDLAGKGGLVWTKRRDDASVSHILIDTVRGTGSQLYSNTTGSQGISTNLITAFNSNGYSIGASTAVNASGSNTASWTFRKAPKFFDVVTYTGNGTAGHTISHSLGVAPGMIIVRRVDTIESWYVWHRSFSNTSANYLVLNTTGAVGTNTSIWNNTAPTATQFTVGTGSAINASGGSYVAYLFAHDTTADGIVQCGSYTTDGSGNATVNLGWEPQFVLFKASSTTGSWRMYDNMRGIATGGNDAVLYANLSSAEDTASNAIDLNATGFSVSGQSASATFIYLAIRRGPMRVPTDATKVFKPISRTGTGAAVSVTSFGSSPDAIIIKNRANPFSLGPSFNTRLVGRPWLSSSGTGAETSPTTSNDFLGFDIQNGYRFGTQNSQDANDSSYTYINYGIARAPGFFDVTCYSGVGSHQNITHQLGVAPELVIIKRRDSSGDWWSYAKTGGFAFVSNSAAQQFALNTTNGAYKSSDASDLNLVTTTTFSTQCGFFGSGYTDISGAKYVAYLFASCPGVSKVGSYSGNGSSQSIDCGFTNGARFVLIKRTDSTGDWFIHDSAMGITSSNDPTLALNSTTAQINNNGVAPLASGFSVSFDSYVANRNPNVSGATYIYLAIA